MLNPGKYFQIRTKNNGHIRELLTCSSVYLPQNLASSISLLAFARASIPTDIDSCSPTHPPSLDHSVPRTNTLENSVNLLHLPDDLLLEDGQDGVIVTDLLENDTTVKLVAHFLEVEPVLALFGKQLLELAQSDHTAFD